MIATITQYRHLAVDHVGNILPIGGARIASEKRTSAGSFAALDSNARFIRVASDTGLEVTIGGKSDFVPANSPEFFQVGGGEAVSVAVVA